MSIVTPIFIPGLLCTARLFAAQRSAPDATGLLADTTTYDSITGMAKAALDLCAGMVVPIGLSMGGYVALEMARLAPDRVAGMALLSTNCRQDTDAQRQQRRDLIKLSKHKGFQGITRHLLPRLLSDTALADEALVEDVLAMARETGRDGFTSQQTAILGRQEQMETLSGFRAPLLVLCGQLDVLTPPDLSREMADLVPHADLCLLDGVGHLSAMEAPDAVTSAVTNLCKKSGMA